MFDNCINHAMRSDQTFLVIRHSELQLFIHDSLIVIGYRKKWQSLPAMLNYP